MAVTTVWLKDEDLTEGAILAVEKDLKIILFMPFHFLDVVIVCLLIGA